MVNSKREGDNQDDHTARVRCDSIPCTYIYIYIRKHSRTRQDPLSLSRNRFARYVNRWSSRGIAMTSIPRLFVPPIPQKLTEVAQKFYRVIRVIISSVYPAIVRSAKQAQLRSPVNFFSYEARMRFVGNLVRDFRLLLCFICDETAASLIFRKTRETWAYWKFHALALLARNQGLDFSSARRAGSLIFGRYRVSFRFIVLCCDSYTACSFLSEFTVETTLRC